MTSSVVPHDPCGYGIDEMHGCHRPKLLVLYVVGGFITLNDSAGFYNVIYGVGM